MKIIDLDEISSSNKIKKQDLENDFFASALDSGKKVHTKHIVCLCFLAFIFFVVPVFS